MPEFTSVADPGEAIVNVGGTPTGVAVILATIVNAKGDLIVATADDTVNRLAVGGDGRILQANSAQASGLEWVVFPGIATSEIDAKGDLLVGTADNAVNNLPVGADGRVLVADSAQAAGVKWAVSPGLALATAHGNAGGSEDFVFRLGGNDVHTVTLNQATCTVTFSGATASTPSRLEMVVTQDATGGRAITWPAAVKWPNGTAPTLSSGANQVDHLAFMTVDGGTTIYGRMIATNIS